MNQLRLVDLVQSQVSDCRRIRPHNSGKLTPYSSGFTCTDSRAHDVFVKLHLSSILLLGLLSLAPLAQAQFYIREQNGNLTTDLPGVTITPTGAPDQWWISVPLGREPGQYFGLGIPTSWFAEPESDLANHLLMEIGDPITFQRIEWTSDVVFPLEFLSPNPVTDHWSHWVGSTEESITVVWEDLGDSPKSVPDGGNTSEMILAAVTVIGVATRMLKRTVSA